MFRVLGFRKPKTLHEFKKKTVHYNQTVLLKINMMRMAIL